MQDLSLLQTFFVFASSVNMTEAAKKRGLSQPAITQHLQALEAGLGKQLFTFQGKKKVLSPYGKSFHRYLEQEFSQLSSKYSSFIQTTKDLSDVELRIGGRRELLNQFIDRYDLPCKQTYKESSSDDAYDDLLKGDIDIAICYDCPSLDYLEKKVFMKSSLHFLVHKKAFKNKKITLKHFKDSNFLKSIPFLSYRRPPPHIEQWCSLIGAHLKDLDFRYSIDNWMKVGELIAKGKGWTLCPSSFKAQSKDVIEVKVPESVLTTKPIYLVYLKSLKDIINLDGYKA